MTWGTQRTATASWRTTRLRILERDCGRCHVCGVDGADQVDHVVALAEGGTQDDANLAAVHAFCHRKKTAQEANRIRWAGRHRAPEPHPGLIEPGEGPSAPLGSPSSDSAVLRVYGSHVRRPSEPPTPCTGPEGAASPGEYTRWRT